MLSDREKSREHGMKIPRKVSGLMPDNDPAVNRRGLLSMGGPRPAHPESKS
jgi:hypothetical protein